jgi:hypothetical protein
MKNLQKILTILTPPFKYYLYEKFAKNINNINPPPPQFYMQIY